nr:MAG TPA: hypothetical protein [Caudoviricetes sp.]
MNYLVLSIPHKIPIEQVKMLPEPLLASVSACIKLLEAAQCNFTENHVGHAKPKNKQTFFV